MDGHDRQFLSNLAAGIIVPLLGAVAWSMAKFPAQEHSSDYYDMIQFAAIFGATFGAPLAIPIFLVARLRKLWLLVPLLVVLAALGIEVQAQFLFDLNGVFVVFWVVPAAFVAIGAAAIKGFQNRSGSAQCCAPFDA